MNMLKIPISDMSGDWIRISCPLAHATHEDKDDTNPSSGVTISDEGISIVHCFACGTRTLADVMHGLYWTQGFDHSVFKYYLENENFDSEHVEEEIEFNDKFSIKKERRQPVAVPEQIFENFEPIDNASVYLEYRGIDLELARQHGLMFCREFTTAEGGVWRKAIVSSIRDIDFKTYWLHFRSIDSKKFWHGKPEHFGVNMEWGRDDSWFGIEFLDTTIPVILVEGAFDCLRLKTLGISNVIAAHGSIGKKSYKLQRILDLKPVLLYNGFDSDDAGKTFKKNVRRRADCEVIDLDWSKIGLKDPGELKSKEDFLKVLENKNMMFKDKFRRKAHELV